MAKAKIAVTLDDGMLRRLDALVRAGRFANRSQAVEAAVEAQLARLERTRLAAQCALLDAADERQWAELGLEEDARAWPRY
jgi:Arc/MetJ-type ribon-helix-helix transcriptional regulator